MLDHMFRRAGAGVLRQFSGADSRFGGMASQEEQKLLLQLVKPKYFIPVHGEYRHLFRHAALAHQLGVGLAARSCCWKMGSAWSLRRDGAFRRDPVTAGRVLVDSGSLEEIEEIVVRDRKHLSEEGVVIPIIAIDQHTGRVESVAGDCDARVDEARTGNEMLAGARECVARTVETFEPRGAGRLVGD